MGSDGYLDKQDGRTGKVKFLLLVSVCVNLGYLVAWLAPSVPLPALAPVSIATQDCDGRYTFPSSSGTVTSAAHEARQLGGNDEPGTSTATSSLSSSQNGHSGGHPHDALLFLFNALVIGAAVMHLSSHFHFMQETVTLFVLGLLFSLVFEGLELKNDTGVFGTAYSMWMDIDPHLLLFTLLPALLAGDAMTIDTTVAKRVAYQCLYLAGPGVLINAFVTAGFLMWYLDWPFLLSLVMASILCATDPVAVVALLKELGASPVLTVQIQGESLLNDGTAIVLYLVAYDLLKGESANGLDIIMFLVKTALMALALGAFIGYFFLSWIRCASNKFNHSSGMIQISLTICCAYWSFIMAEGVFHMSGVLATVASSLVLAHHMWPHIVCRHSLHHVWHTIESLGNTIIFFLAGALTGNVMVHIEPINFLKVFGIYAVLSVVRASLIFASRPLLRLLSTDGEAVSVADAAVMSWGGLRGAVGLAMAIGVNREGAPDKNGIPQISNENAQLVLFHVSAVAFLTTIINATTAPSLVHKLGITALPSEQLRLLRFIYEQLVWVSQDAAHPKEVTDNLMEMLEDVKHHVELHKAKTDRAKKGGGMMGKEFSIRDTQTMSGNNELISKLRRAEEKYQKINQEQDLQLMGAVPQTALMGRVDEMVELLQDSETDLGMAKVINKTFLNMVYTNYWRLIKKGNLRAATEETELLLTSIRVGMSCMNSDLVDFDFIERQMIKSGAQNVQDWWKVFPDDSDSDDENAEAVSSASPNFSAASREQKERSSVSSSSNRRGPVKRCCRLHRHIVRSGAFNVSMAVFITLNSIYVAVEEAARGSDDSGGIWLAIEICFTAIFLVEFLLKFADRKFKYFKSPSNIFDLVLVIFGVVGVVLEAGEDLNAGGSNEARILKVTRVFRVLRFLRVFRLFHAKLSMDKEVSPTIGKHLQRIVTLVCFSHAHLNAQVSLIKYFGVNGKIDEPEERELARCVLQSQLSVYRAFNLAYREESSMDPALVKEIKFVSEKKSITENLQTFVMDAYEDGAIEAREAESILHPLNRELSACLKTLNDFTDGIMSTANHTLMAKVNTEPAEKKPMMGVRTNTLHKADEEDELS